MNTTPKIQFSYWSEKVGLHARWCPPQSHPPIEVGNAGNEARGFLYSSDGNFIAIKTPTHVSILRSENMELVSVLKMHWVSQVVFSPLSTYVVTWTPSDRAGADVQNLRIFDIKTGELVIGWVMKRKLSWPLVQWSSDELITGVLLQVGKVNFYAGVEFKAPVQTITHTGLTQFFMGPGKHTNVAVFVPDKASVPGTLSSFAYPQVTKEIMQKVSFFADSIEVLWNEKGDGMLLLVTKDVDESNYYGKKGLFFINLGTKFFTRVTDEYVHDVQWNPNSTEFACIFGAMPYPKVSLFNMKCDKTADLVNGEEARNKLLYDPYGRILCVGGFGSLNGDMDFWDLTKPDLKKVGRASAFSASFQEWCPDSRHFMACVVSPRMKMDNGIKVFNYLGELVYEERVPDLYQVNWRPAPKGSFPQKEVEAAKKTTTEGPAKYRHPHAAQAANQSAAPGRGGGPVRYGPGGAVQRPVVGGGSVVGGARGGVVGGAPRAVVGATPVGGAANSAGGASKTAQKNAKKKAAKEASDVAAREAAIAAMNPNAKPAAVDVKTPEASASPQDPERQKKQITKKLQEIEVLKQKRSEGAKLDPNQEKKVASEDSLRAQLATLSK